jgi:hypothetical protein
MRKLCQSGFMVVWSEVQMICAHSVVQCTACVNLDHDAKP